MSRRSRKVLLITLYDVARTPFGDMLLPMLTEGGWEATLVAPNATKSLLGSHLPYKVRPVDLSEKRLVRELEVQKWLAKGLLGRYDVLYIHSQNACLRTTLLAPACRKVVYHNPDYFDPIKHRVQACLEGWVARRAALHINNEFHRGYIVRAQYRLRCPILTVPPNLSRNWPIPDCDQNIRNEISGGESDAYVLMLHGSYTKLRMVDELLEAMAILPSRFRLVMVQSSACHAYLERRLTELRISNRVHFIAPSTYQEMLRYTVNADAGVLLYANNDLGNFFTAPGRLTEYLACGLPVLGSNHTGLEWLVRRLEIGECAEATLPTSIRDAVVRLARGSGDKTYAGYKMRGVFVEKLAVENWSETVLRAFESVAVGGMGQEGLPPRYPWGDSL